MYDHNSNIPSPPDYPDPTLNLLPLPTPSSDTYFKTLHHNSSNRILSAITFMWGLHDYTEECLYKQAEYKADEQEKMHNNHNITYPKHDTLATPHSWSAVGSEYSTPDIIEQSHPLGPRLQ